MTREIFMSLKNFLNASYFSLFFVVTLLLPCSLAAQEDGLGTYKGPSAMVALKDGTKIFVANFDAGEIAVVDTKTSAVVQTLPTAPMPNGVALSVDEKVLYVTSGAYQGKIQTLDAATGEVLCEVTAGHTPMAPLVSHDGTKLYVCNRFDAKISEYELPALTQTRQFPAVREPRGSVLTADGKKLYVINMLPLQPANFPENPEANIHVAAEVTIVDLTSGETKNILLPNGSGSLMGICISPDGRYVYVTEVFAKFLLPTVRVEKGWMNTSAISIFDTTKVDEPGGGFVNTVLTDEVDKGAANPWGITTSADGKQLYIAVAGTSELLVIDAAGMHAKLDSLDATAFANVPNDPAFLSGLKERIPLDGQAPRAILALGQQDARRVYLGMYFSDTVQSLDLTAAGTIRGTTIPLGPEPQLTAVRRGEIYWNDATLCMQTWQSCASCHPDARMDGYNWDLLNDGMGNPKNAKSLFFCHESPPAMWQGVRASSPVCTRAGFEFIQFVAPDEEKCLDIDEYIGSLKAEKSPFLVDGKLSEQAERGKILFADLRCDACHPDPKFTDQKLHNVKTRCYYDRTDNFDTPTLLECWRTAPYLHDGRYVKMRDVFKEGKHGDVLGDVGGLTDEQIDDLVEYVLSL